jgi:Ser/Thr protein kinase RdoA (MazF antagonist)
MSRRRDRRLPPQAMLDPIPFATLTPDRVLHAVEAAGYHCDGRLLALNSYENRVYRVGIEDAPALVVKFYRTGRWSDAAILEEHAFAEELAADEIPVVPPLADSQGRSLHHDSELRFALYPNRAGRAPELDDPEVLRWIGRFLGRLHVRGAARRFHARPLLTVERLGHEPAAFLEQSTFVPQELRASYASVVRAALTQVEAIFAALGEVRRIRLHGDCHPGNILWTDRGPHFVDLDDCQTGPAIQDLWMLLSGTPHEMTAQLAHVLEGYEAFRDFDPVELGLIEALRTLRVIHYAAWLARRWDDPAFPRSFPWFNTQRYWQDHILILREQIGAMQEPPLAYPC